MPSNSNTASGLNPNKESHEWIDKTVSAAFDELFVEITSKWKFHPTEKYNREDENLEHAFSKIYDIVNSYHAFCRLCEQHFYSRSLPDDVNSFFQKHINTSYHKQMRAFCLPPNDVPMFTWEEKFHTGRCNVCDMSGLNSYVLDTTFDPLKLMKLHYCIWNQENRETNEKVLRKLNLLKSFCGLTVFRDLHIKTVNGKVVCLLCGINLPWSKEKAGCHLVSDQHYQSFCLLLKKCFGFAPKDALNGFNLEMITRWLIVYNPPILKEFIDYDERKICYQDSNSCENPYSNEQNNFSYCPARIEKLLKDDESDFIQGEECLLCSVPFVPGHITSEQHQIKMMTLNVKSFDTLQKFKIQQKQQKILHIIENYKNLKLGLEKTPQLKKKVENTKKKPSSQMNFSLQLLVEKLNSMSTTFKEVPNKEEVFCQICDQHLSKEQKMTHLNSTYHKSQEVKWEQLKVQFESKKFLDPFKKIKKTLLCLLCGVVFNVNCFFSHVKGEMHLQRFVWYCNLNNSIPISSALVFKSNLSCYCTVCKTLLTERGTFSSQKEVLKFVKLHWPCPKVKEKEAELAVKSEAIDELTGKNQNTTKDITCSTCRRAFEESMMKSHRLNCSKKILDFKKIEKTVESLMNIFEKKLMSNAFYKSAHLISRLDNSKLVTTKEKIKKILEVEEQPTACEKTTCESALKRPDGPSSVTKRRKEVDKKCEEITENQFRIQNIGNNIKEQKQKESSKKKEKEEESPSKVQKQKESSKNKKKKEESPSKVQKRRESTGKEKKNGEFVSEEEKKKETANENESTIVEEKEVEFTSEEEQKREISTEEEEEEKGKFRKEEEIKEEFTSEEKEKKESSTEEEEKGKFRREEEIKEEFTSEEKEKKESSTEEEKKGKFRKEEEIKEEFTSEEKQKKESLNEEEEKGKSRKQEEIKGQFTSEEEPKRESTNEKENNKESTIDEERKGESKSKEEKEHEVLVIEGLPKNKRILKAIYSRFRVFGKIDYVFFEKERTVLAFNEPGKAKMVAKRSDITINDHKVTVTVSTRKKDFQAERLPSLNQDIICLLQDPPRLMDFIMNLIWQAMAALDSPVERRREELVCSTVISAILEYFPHSRCYPFGSRLSGLMLNNSDLDVFLDCGGMYEGFKFTTPSSERNLVKDVAKLLRRKREIKEMIVVERARVPIVSFLHVPTLMRCDLSFKNGLSIQNTLLIKFMLSLDWRVRPLILFLKYWTKMNGLHGPPYFSSYAIAMLVIFYLEQLPRPVLPTIEFLQNSFVGRRTTIGGWDCSINMNPAGLPKSENNDPVPKLLSDLFKFYAEFDYSENIISPLTGKPLPRKEFSKTGFPKLPMCYKRHILNIPTPIENLVNSNILICVMDPFDLSHILTKSFTSQGLRMFIGCCQKSRTCMEKGLQIFNLKQ